MNGEGAGEIAAYSTLAIAFVKWAPGRTASVLGGGARPAPARECVPAPTTSVHLWHFSSSHSSRERAAGRTRTSLPFPSRRAWAG
jgi:hypothetical protein